MFWSAFPGAIILLGLFHGYHSQICNVTVPIRSPDGTIHERTQLGCCPGYFVAKIPRTTKTYCKAKCNKACVNGRCTGPNVCTCKAGYEFESEFTKTNCVAKCDNCTNGSCIRPNVCQCRLKFYKNEDGICVPNCSPACIQGTCIAPNVCQCLDGYQHNNHSKHICEPTCEKSCLNGFCSGVNECTCWNGFTRDIEDPSRCTKRVCGNGVVDSEGRCVCPDNFELIVGIEVAGIIKEECVEKVIPICDQKCIESACSAEERCQCGEGYEKRINEGEFQCLPICELDCVNGHCVAPNQCECSKGYKSDAVDDSHDCIAVCEQNCTNGFCSSPNTCTCSEGYERGAVDGGECLPKCDNCTTNQECVAPGECQCKGNYRVTLDGRDCEEIICNSGVIYEGNCRCPEGFVLDDTSTCREIQIELTETVKEEDEITTETVIAERALEVLTLEKKIEEDLISYTEHDVTQSDMEIISTTNQPCINGKVVDGKCTCSQEDIQFMDNECVPRSVVEYQVTDKLICSEKCISGKCHANGTCICPVHYKLSPDDETECLLRTVCEICFNNDLFPCPTYCFAAEYSPQFGTILPQYLIITLACLITVAIAIISFVLYKRMQKHEYYTGPVDNSAPIYAYEMETLT